MEAHLPGLDLGFLLTALPAERVELGQAKLAQQITGAAQKVAGEAQFSAGLRGQLGAIGRYLSREQ